MSEYDEFIGVLLIVDCALILIALSDMFRSIHLLLLGMVFMTFGVNLTIWFLLETYSE